VEFIRQRAEEHFGIAEIMRELSMDQELAHLMPSRRTVFSIVKEAPSDPEDVPWDFFDPATPPEGAREVMDYLSTLPDHAGADPRHRPSKKAAQRFIRIRRVYPEIEARRAMQLAYRGRGRDMTAELLLRDLPLTVEFGIGLEIHYKDEEEQA